MKIDVSTDIELCNQPIHQLGVKLQAVLEYKFDIEPSKVSGYSNDLEVKLNFYDSSDNLIAHLNGDYRESDDTMPSILTIYNNGNGSTFNMNWHPFGSMGGLDENAFVKQLSL